MTPAPEPAAVLNTLREPAAFGGNPPLWAEAMAARPPRPPFLEPAALPARRLAAGLPPDRDPLLAAAAAAIRSDPALAAYAWYLHWRIFVEPQHGVPWGAPALLSRLGDLAGPFHLLLALEFVPALRACHASRGYPETVTADTLRQIACFELNHLRGRGRPGMYENQLPWLATYLVDPYVRLGRLEYQLTPFGGGVLAWKRGADGRVLALAEPGARVADSGARLDAKAPPDQGWTATLEETADAVTGFPVDPAGHIVRKQVRLARAAWRPCLRKGDTVLSLHIPAGGGMTWEAVADSFRQALAFFPRFHPGRPFAALTCGTWFMDPQLAAILPPDSHMLRLQRAVYLYPVSWGNGGLWFVFQRDMAATPPAALPRDTSLQRALADFLARGGAWNCGGLLLMPGEMARLREGCYREGFANLLDALGTA